MTHPIRKALAAALLAASVLPATQAFEVRITIENLAPSSPTGLHLAPVWLGFHDGSFDLFNPGMPAAPEIEQLAELGSAALIQSAFAASQPMGWNGVLNRPGGPGPGIFEPGTSNSLWVNLDPMYQRYFSWAAMVVPSNDSFIANANPMAAQLFDGMGNFAGAQSWIISGAQVWDAGTEMNDPANGPAFLAGSNALLGAAENGVIHQQPLNGLDNMLGQQLATGATLGEALNPHPLFRISIEPVPEPSTYGLIGCGVLLALVGYRARQQRRTQLDNKLLIPSSTA
jgi:hypothetical protein